MAVVGYAWLEIFFLGLNFWEVGGGDGKRWFWFEVVERLRVKENWVVGDVTHEIQWGWT